MKHETITSSFIWRLLERFGAQFVTLVVSIILARVLDPETYGTVALVTVITTILQVFVDGGFGKALVQKKDADDLDFSTVFWFNLLICLILYVLLFVFAPLIASFYSMPSLTPVIRALGLIIIISGFKSIQQAYVSRHLLFKKFFYATLIGTIVAAFLGIYLAINGFGVWALVLQNLANQFIDTLVLWFIIKWKPSFSFSKERFKALFAFGWKILLTNLINKTYTELRSLIIGKKYSSTDLAFYNKGNQFPQLIETNVTTSIDSVLLPVMSQRQDDIEKVKTMTRKAIKLGAFLSWPCMIGLAACAKSIIGCLLTEKWLDAVPYMQIFCITYAFYPIHTANLNALKALGRSDITLKLEIIKKVIGITILLISMRFGVFWIACSGIVSSIFSQIINSYPSKHIFQYTYKEQIFDMCPSIFLSLFMGGCVFGVGYLLQINYIFKLLIQIPLGICIYYFGALVFKFPELNYCLNTLKNLVKKRKRT